MTTISVTCPGCGATYRIPETTKATKATCRKCQASIPLAVREPEPPPAEPAGTVATLATVAAAKARSSTATGTLPKPRVSARERIKNQSPGFRIGPFHIIAGVFAIGAMVAYYLITWR
jgi:hypothetical protein